MGKKIHIIGGGTFSYVRNHLALCAPAFGQTAQTIEEIYGFLPETRGLVETHLTKMAGGDQNLATNKDVSDLIDRLVADPDTHVIIMNAALCDYQGKIVEERHGEDVLTASGKYASRLKTSDGYQTMGLIPADKIIGRIRKVRKDIFAVGFKTTAGATPDEQYVAGLNLLKANSLNLVVANDTVTRHNMIVAPEETRYYETDDRLTVLTGLVEMVMARKDNTFTRSTVVEGDLVKWESDDAIPANLRAVVDYAVARGAYKPFRGSTAGHFAVRVDQNKCLTSVRKTNYNDVRDLVMCEYSGFDKVVAHGAKPSVGGQSQRIIFDTYPDADCIFHAHIPLRDNPRDAIPVAEQWKYECGSHGCGNNTASNLVDFDGIKAVMLEGHGPNIVFSRHIDAQRVIEFIEANFDLTDKTGGMFTDGREMAEAV